jgi:sugar lactone lactonase YvrE
MSPNDVHRTESGLYLPQDVAFAQDGTAYVADFNTHRIRRVAPDGTVTTLTGTGAPGDGHGGLSTCAVGCDATGYEWWHPSQVAFDPEDPDVLYAAAWHNSRINRIDVSGGVLTWVTGTGVQGYGPDELGRALLNLPSSVAFADGVLYWSDQGNQLVRRRLPDGTIETVAGTPGLPGYAGDGGPATHAQLHGHPDWMGGPSNKLDVRRSVLLYADTTNNVIRTIDLDTGIIERFAGRFESSGRDFVTNPLDGTEHYVELGGVVGYDGDGGPALDALFAHPRDVAFGPDGEVYVADSANHCVRVIRPDGVVEAFAGRCGEEPGYEGDGVPALEARMDLPCGVALDDDGNVYVSDSNNHVIRRVAARPRRG